VTDDDKSTASRNARAIQLLRDMDGYEGSDLAKSRKDAWDYYLQRPRGDEVEGRSPVVTGDVSAMVESTTSQVTEAFATDELAEFEGANETDEVQGKLEGRVVSKVIMGGNGWFRVASAVKSALLLRSGVLSAEVCRYDETEVVALEGVDTLARVVLEEQYGAKFVSYDPEAKVGTLERTYERQVLDVRHINSENFLFVRWPLDDFENIPACAERCVTTRQHLIDKQYVSEEKADKLRKWVPSAKSDETAHHLRGSVPNVRGVSRREELVEWFKLYYLYDGNRYRAIAGDNKILTEEVVARRPPYAIGVPFINPGHVDGFSIFDKVKGSQDINTALTRMLNDNANAVTMSRLAVLEGACNNDNLTDQDPSGVLQFRRSKVGGDIRNGVMPLNVQDLTAGLITSLQYQRTVRSEMGGASLDVGTGQVQLPDRMGSMGLDRAYSASEQLSALVLKTFSQTLVKDLWLLVHDLLRTEWTGPLPVKVEGRWITAKPSEWPRRSSVFVKPGMSPGERQRRSQALGALIQLQTQLATAGMEDILVDAERYYRTVCDWARLNDLAKPEQYLIDPTSPKAVQAMQLKMQQAQAQAAASKQLQQMALALEQMGKAIDKYGIDVKAATEKYRIDNQTDQKEAELTVGLVRDREKAEAELRQPGLFSRMFGKGKKPAAKETEE
jgi:hypothetical protein